MDDRRGQQEWGAAEARAWIRVPRADDDKYSRGVLGMITGSDDYPGAAVLGVEAAARTGTGMIRYSGPEKVTTAVLTRRPEVVAGIGRSQAWLLGSGMNPERRSAALRAELADALSHGAPVVLDSGALDLVDDVVGPAVITPHFRELAGVLNGRVDGADAGSIAADPIAWAMRAAELLEVTVLLKGSRTVVAQPGSVPIVLPVASSWLATAGSGDVLAGILGALLATNHREVTADPRLAMPAIAATASWVHARAGELASGGGPITALDIAEDVPPTIAALLA